VARRERDILEHAVRRISEQAANTNKVIDEAMEAGLAADHPVTVAPPSRFGHLHTYSPSLPSRVPPPPGTVTSDGTAGLQAPGGSCYMPTPRASAVER
jgi:hypothetical protein